MRKTCTKCKEEKEVSEFSKDKYSLDKLKDQCKACASVYFKKWRNDNLTSIRKQDRVKHYIRRYGLDQALAEQFVESRLGVCEICTSEAELVVDHNHESGKVRGFICSFCNSALGYCRENKEILFALANYLEKHK